MNTINECCENESNRVEIERRETRGPDGEDGGPLIVYRCAVCGRKHYVHEVAPIHVGLEFVSGNA